MRTAIFFSLFVSLPAWADHVVIAAGSTKADEAQAALAKLQAQKISLLTLPQGYPKLIQSDTLPGLKPGFHIVIVGICSDGAKAQIAADLMAVGMPGAYVRKVESKEDACPKLASDKPSSTKGYRDSGSRLLKAGSPITLTLFEQLGTGKCDAANSIMVRATYKKRVIAEALYEGFCMSPPEGGDPGSYTGHRAEWKDGDPTAITVTVFTPMKEESKTLRLTLEGLAE